MYALVFLNGPESIFQRWSPNPDGRRQGGEKERTIKANIVVKSVPANATAVIAAGKARSQFHTHSQTKRSCLQCMILLNVSNSQD